MLRLEAPQLSLPVKKIPFQQWLWQASRCDEGSVIASIAHENGTIFAPKKVDLNSYSFLPSNVSTLDFPSNFYDAVFIHCLLEMSDLEHRRKLLLECGRVLKPGGRIVSVSRACDDNQEVFDLMYPTGIDVSSFVNSRLNSKDIAVLRPTESVFIKSVVRMSQRKLLVEYLHKVGIVEAKLEHLWKAGTNFATNRLLVGMMWQTIT